MQCKHAGYESGDPFGLYEASLSFLSGDKRSLPVLGDAGTGKTQFALQLTARLLEEDDKVLPIYIRLSSPVIQSLQSGLLEDVLTKQYFLTPEEAGRILQLGQTEQQFCFIIDAVDEFLNKHRDDLQARDIARVNNLYGMFTHGKCIFMCRTKVPGLHHSDLLTVFTPNTPHCNLAPELRAESLLLQPFNDDAKNTFIRLYIENRLYKQATPDVIENYRARIRDISFLDNIISKPIMLKMTMRVLRYLEAFYAQRPNETRKEADVRLSLIHI